MVEDLFKAVKEDIGFLKELFSKDMAFVNPDGEEFNKDEFAGVEIIEMFENIKIKENNSTDGSGSAIETTHYSTGDTWTEIWSDFSVMENTLVKYHFHFTLHTSGRVIR